MSLQQMSALGGGRGFKRPYVEEINARTPYLPQLYGMKQQERFRKQQLGLDQRRLAQEKTFGLANLNLQEEAVHEAKKRNKTAQNLGLANIGLAGGLGLYDAVGQPSLSDIGDWFSPSSGGDFIENLGMWDPTGFSGGGGGDSGLFDYSDILDGWEGLF
jgi:hypothetical protein